MHEKKIKDHEINKKPKTKEFFSDFSRTAFDLEPLISLFSPGRITTTNIKFALRVKQKAE